jgi:hypothetical protein
MALYRLCAESARRVSPLLAAGLRASEFYTAIQVTEQAPGAPATDPQILVEVWLYAIPPRHHAPSSPSSWWNNQRASQHLDASRHWADRELPHWQTVAG